MEDRKVSPCAEKRLRGYAIEKLKERDMEKTRTLIFDIDVFSDSGVYYEPHV
jgi:hypothetical protein